MSKLEKVGAGSGILSLLIIIYGFVSSQIGQLLFIILILLLISIILLHSKIETFFIVNLLAFYLKNEERISKNLRKKYPQSNVVRILFDPEFDIKEHFAATTFVIDIRSKDILLIFNQFHKRYLPPGGRTTHNEFPAKCAKRRVINETGLTDETKIKFNKYFCPKDHSYITEPNIKPQSLPYRIQIEDKIQRDDVPVHHDYIYVSTADKDNFPIDRSIEGYAPDWYSLDNINHMSAEEKPFQNVILLYGKIINSLNSEEYTAFLREEER